MGKSLRFSEKWFTRGLWLVAVIFANFLIGLGSTIVQNLPKVENNITIESFILPARLDEVSKTIEASRKTARDANEKLQQANLVLSKAQANTQFSREAYSNWLATRSVTQRSEQDPEIISRTAALDQLVGSERSALALVEAQQKIALDANQAMSGAQLEMQALRDGANEQFNSARHGQELRVFLYRLMLTLPLLAVAGWLFVKKRKSTYWPFVWGFIFFAVFAFFVELVPYLPSYGGVVRYVVGIVLTVIGGRYAIKALQAYLERQKLAEAMPEEARRQDMDYDVAQAHLAKGICPGCERPADLKDVKNDFCPHCGLNLFKRCVSCDSRKSAFSRYCYSCGTLDDGR